MLNPKGPEQESPAQPLKEMLTWSKTGSQAKVRINFSSLDLLQTCSRKAYYALNLGLRADRESDATAFGSAIHKALEHWYQLPVEERQLPTSLYEETDMLAYGHGIAQVAKQGAMEAMRQFVLAKWDTLSILAPEDKRSLTSGLRILLAYFKRYHDDGFVVARDDKGPLIERDFTFTLYESPDMLIEYFGRIDCILQNVNTGFKMVTDHKTTATLGKEFYDRCKPNPQYTGYVMGAKLALDIDTNLFMINGIQTAKTKHEFARQVTERTEEDFNELRASVIYQSHNWLTLNGANSFPQAGPNPCSMYGGCTYRKICEVPNKLKDTVIQAEYKTRSNL